MDVFVLRCFLSELKIEEEHQLIIFDTLKKTKTSEKQYGGLLFQSINTSYHLRCHTGTYNVCPI